MPNIWLYKLSALTTTGSVIVGANGQVRRTEMAFLSCFLHLPSWSRPLRLCRLVLLPTGFSPWIIQRRAQRALGGIKNCRLRGRNWPPWRGSGGFGGSPHLKRRHPPLALEWGVWGVPPFEGATSAPSRGDGCWSGALPRRSLSVVCSLSVCYDRDETFGGGWWQCRERLSPEPARLVEVRPKKGREIRILQVAPL